jgi:magnesium-transporting ATPase (P-type)
VESARQIGIRFKEVKKNKIYLDVLEEKHEVDLLHIFEFNSDRKRMSAIIREEDGTIKLYCKGADSMIIERLKEGSEESELMTQTNNFLYKSSVKGFRTLMMAMRILEEEEYREWKVIFDKAEMDIHHKEKKLAKAYELIEKDLVYLGCSTVEDKLQENVPRTIADLQAANISIWMLTGDKLETAENIGNLKD